MKIPQLLLSCAIGVSGFAMLAGCDDTREQEKSVQVKDNGTVVTKEKKVTEKSDGTVVTQERKDVSH